LPIEVVLLAKAEAVTSSRDIAAIVLHPWISLAPQASGDRPSQRKTMADRSVYGLFFKIQSIYATTEHDH
jgi:hypothetical protein